MMYHNRKAFSMLVALVVIILMTVVASFILNLSGKIIKETTTQFQKEQSVLLAKSYTEYAIMSVMSNDRNVTGNDCIENINGKVGNPVNGQGYEIRTRIAYIGNDGFDNCSNTRILSNAVTTPESSLNIIVDVYIKYRDIDHPSIGIDNTVVPWTTYHRRTLQKI